MGRKRIIGLTGTIGAGKSTVAALLKELGCGIVDSDELAHAVLQVPEVRRQLEQWWGPEVLTVERKVDRRRVADIVFDDPAQRARLEALVHPLIDRRRRELFARFEADDSVPAIVLDAPLLYEKGLDKLCDRVIFVDADPAVRWQRVKRSRGWTQQDVRRREESQAPPELKRKKADYVILNNHSVEACRKQVQSVFTNVTIDGGASDGQGRLKQSQNQER